MSKLVKYGKEINVGDQIVVYKYAGMRLGTPEVREVVVMHSVPHVAEHFEVILPHFCTNRVPRL